MNSIKKKQKEFEQMIEEEVTELEFMEQNLKKTKELTEKMVKIKNQSDFSFLALFIFMNYKYNL